LGFALNVGRQGVNFNQQPLQDIVVFRNQGAFTRYQVDPTLRAVEYVAIALRFVEH